MKTGVIFDIQRYCISDGTGIRTVVFFKGCPLHCSWCHNKEGICPAPELLFDAQKCVFCGRCAAVCPHGVHRLADGHALARLQCSACGACVRACPAGALELAGRTVGAAELAAELARDADYFRLSGGGVTFSGGEPLMQAEFLCETARILKERGIHVAVETSGCVPTDGLLRAARCTDLFLYDVKDTDARRLHRYTGGDLGHILANLRALDDLGKPIVLRCPLIGGVNAEPEHISRVVQLAKSMKNACGIEFLPYHDWGETKAARVGARPFRAETPAAEALREFCETAARAGVRAEIV